MAIPNQYVIFNVSELNKIDFNQKYNQIFPQFNVSNLRTIKMPQVGLKIS